MSQLYVTGEAKIRNLTGALTASSGIVDAIGIGTANGLATLDGSAKLTSSQLPNSVMELKGDWNASTNTPTLANGVGNIGDMYRCSVPGTVDFGAGGIYFYTGDLVLYTGSIWQKNSASINLTTIGNSGPSSFIANVLNVPYYTIGGLGGVPNSRLLSINGTQYDLSTDRAWNIPINPQARNEFNFTATAGQTSFATAGYVVNQVDVFYNGAKLIPSDFTATDGINVILGFSCVLNDTVTVLAYVNNLSIGGGGTSGSLTKWTGTSTLGNAVAGTDYQAPGNYITALTGDITASGPGSVAATLATVNINTGTFGSSTAIPVVTVNGKGLITAMSTTAVSIPSGALSFIGDVTGTGTTGSNTTLTLATVNSNVYGSNTFLKLAVNGKGLNTSATPVVSSDIIGALGYTPEDVANKSTSTSLGTSNTLYPTQNAVKTYVDSAVAGGVILQGDWNASTNSPNISSTTITGWAWRVSVAGSTNIGGITDWQIGDLVVKTATGWLKIDNTDSITSVFGRYGAITASSGDYNTSQVTENTNLYFTNARAQGAISLTTTGTSGVATYSSGVLNIPNYGSALSSYVPYSGATTNVNLGSNNIYANAFFSGFSSITASGSQIILTVLSAPEILVNGSGGQTIKLPDATTLPNGVTYSFNNNQSSGAITVNNNSNTLIVSIPSGGYAEVILLDNTIAAGSWDRHFQAPANVSWSTNTLDYAGSITSATWNGSTIAINRGGTGATTASTALSNLGGIGLTSLSSSATGLTYTNTTGVFSLTAGYVIPTTASATTWDTAYTNRITSLTTTGSSGSATLVSNILNVPTYTLAGLGGISLTSLSATTPLSYNNTTGAFSIQVANGSQNGYLSSTDWTTFNNKQSALTNPITGTGTAGQIGYFNGTNSITSDATFTYSPTAQHLINNSVTAASAIARGTNLTPTLTAAANNDVLVGLDINPTFTLGAFTGTNSIGLRTQVASGSNKWNLYLSGTANNYLGGKLLIGTTTDAGFTGADITGTTRLNGLQTFVGTTASDGGQLGSELLSSSGWTSTGWTGSYPSFTHTTGNTTNLTNTLAAVIGNNYAFTYTITTRTAGTITFSLGGLTFSGASSSGVAYGKATSTASLVITPTTDFDGTVVMSIKQVTAGSATTTFQNSSATANIEVRASGISTTNTFIGLNSGRYNVTGGTQNTSLGSGALASVLQGNSNTAIGYNAGNLITTGNSNTLIGSNAGAALSIANNATLIGVNAGQNITTASGTTIVGAAAGAAITSNSNNTLIGQGAGSAITGNSNTALGFQALNGTSGASAANNVALGYQAGLNIFSGASNVLIGNSAGGYLTSGNNNVIIGNSSGTFLLPQTSGTTLTTNNWSVFVGYSIRSAAQGASNEVVIAGYNGTLGQVGYGSNTTVIGNNLTTNTAIQGNLTLGSLNPVSIGQPVATPSTTGGTLAAGTYYYQIVAVDIYGNTTTPSAEANATTTGTTSSVGLTWTAVTGAASYRIYRGTATNAQNVYYTSSTNSFTDINGTSTAGTVPTSNTTYLTRLNSSGSSVLGGTVNIGTNTSVASAALQITSTTQGFLPPVMTTTQKNAITSPATGLVVFDSTLGKLCVFSTTWQTITSV